MIGEDKTTAIKNKIGFKEITEFYKEEGVQNWGERTCKQM